MMMMSWYDDNDEGWAEEVWTINFANYWNLLLHFFLALAYPEISHKFGKPLNF